MEHTNTNKRKENNHHKTAEPVGFTGASPAATILHQANVHPNAISKDVGHFAHQQFALSHLKLC